MTGGWCPYALPGDGVRDGGGLRGMIKRARAVPGIVAVRLAGDTTVAAPASCSGAARVRTGSVSGPGLVASLPRWPVVLSLRPADPSAWSDRTQDATGSYTRGQREEPATALPAALCSSPKNTTPLVQKNRLTPDDVLAAPTQLLSPRATPSPPPTTLYTSKIGLDTPGAFRALVPGFTRSSSHCVA